MRLTQSAEIACGAEEIFGLLRDPERVAACLPGASVHRLLADGAEGELAVRLGPYTAEYVGTASLREVDHSALRVRAFGQERGDAGRADALVSVRLSPAGDRTRLDVVADLSIRGMAAKFGAGVLAEVSAQTLSRFADNVEQTLSEAPTGGAAPAPPEPAREPSPEPTPGLRRSRRPAVAIAAVAAAAASVGSTYALIRMLRRR